MVSVPLQPKQNFGKSAPILPSFPIRLPARERTAGAIQWTFLFTIWTLARIFLCPQGMITLLPMLIVITAIAQRMRQQMHDCWSRRWRSMALLHTLQNGGTLQIPKTIRLMNFSIPQFLPHGLQTATSISVCALLPVVR